MKNKKAEQAEAKKQHKELLKAHRRKEPRLEREEPEKRIKPTILIVCEGKNTEPSYFEKFKLTSATIRAIGEGYNTVSLVERAKELSERIENDSSTRKYDQVWCVFDADPKADNSKQAESFNKAIKLAEKYGFGVAYSNQAFEYWIILHFEDHQGGAFNRSGYNDKINKLLKPYKVKFEGEGSKIITDSIFELLEGVDEKTQKPRVKLAIERARRNYDLFDHTNPAKEESSTTVFKLIEEILLYV
ncbi:RloB family protein [Cytophagaceae bacterium ABcell3]|nr:RloB family protein [Cytophagaceae bacterium ABcell3]